MSATATSVYLLCAIFALKYSQSEAKVKCHECMEVEKGWCQDQFCEDEFCFIANASLGGPARIRVGCVSTGKLGCDLYKLHFPSLADIKGDFCVCQTDYCNSVKHPNAVPMAPMGVFNNTSGALGAGPLSSTSFSSVVGFCIVFAVTLSLLID